MGEIFEGALVVALRGIDAALEAGEDATVVDIDSLGEFHLVSTGILIGQGIGVEFP